MADAELQAEVASQVRSELQSLRFAPEAEVEERIAALAPVADAADAAARQEIQQEIWTQSRMMLRERHQDPAAYVMEQPAVAEAFASAAKNPALLPDAVRSRLAAQAALGLAPEEQNALTLEERAQILAGLQRLEPQQQFGALLELGRLYGDQAAVVASDLAEAGLSMEMQLATDPSGGPEVIGLLAQARESQGEAKSPAGVVEEAAEKLIAEGRKAAAASPGHDHEISPGVGAGDLPPLPRRKPGVPKHSAHVDWVTSGTAGDTQRSRSQPSDRALLRQNQALRDQSYGEMTDSLHPDEVAAYEEHVRQAAQKANTSAEVEDLARRFVARNLKSGMPFADAVDDALHEAGLKVVEERQIGETEKQARNYLSLMLIAHNEPIYDPERILTFINEIMGIRQVEESQRGAARRDLLSRLKSLEKTDDRFLFPKLRDALNRAVERPELSAWALTDDELRDAYRGTGEFSKFLDDLSTATAPLLFVPWMAEAGSRQQSWMENAYARELRRRGFLTLPEEQMTPSP
jgi:hypothetical protein